MHDRPDPLRAAVGGLAAGLIAAAVMNGFQALWSAASGSESSDEEPTTTKFADKLAQAATGEPLAEPLRKPADPAVHYALSALLGAAYGLVAETSHFARAASAPASGRRRCWSSMRPPSPPSACPHPRPKPRCRRTAMRWPASGVRDGAGGGAPGTGWRKGLGGPFGHFTKSNSGSLRKQNCRSSYALTLLWGGVT